jgi:hypothetical protein
MSEARYRFQERSTGTFELYEDGNLLCEFTRLSFRERLEMIGRGSGWIGSMLRLFHRSYPITYKPRVEIPPVEKVVKGLGDRGIVDYLRQKGYHVFQPLPVIDEQLISYVRSKGYVVARDGILHE